MVSGRIERPAAGAAARPKRANADCSKSRGWHIGLRKALRSAVQELATDHVVQKDAKVLVGSSRGASSSSTACFPQAGEEGRQRERARLFGLVVGDLGR